MNNFLRGMVHQGYALISASHRQARFLRDDYSSWMIEQDHRVWQTPLILPWKQWLKYTWEDEQQIHDSSLPILLSPAQARLIWQSVINESGYVDSKIQLNSITHQTIRAYEICSEWNLEIFPEGLFLNTDTQAFSSWVKDYRTRMKQGNWLDEQGLVDYQIQSSFMPGVPGVVIYGFDEINPQLRSYLQYLEINGCQVEIYKPEGRNQSTQYYEFTEPVNEIRAAAVWAKKIIDAEPDSSIGIVIPDLENRREPVSAIFDDILNPGWINQQPDSMNGVYSFAPGRPLSDYPAVYAGLQILSLGEYRQPIQRLDFLLRSSFIKGCESESSSRARLYSALKATGEPFWRLKTLLRFIEHHRENIPAAPGFTGMLRQVAVYLDQLPTSQSPLMWAESFTHCLNLLGWPGDRPLNSREYQILQEWREKLLTFSELGSICGKLDYQQAMEHLKRILSEDNFQPETQETPIQISGLPGVAGMAFDHLWIMDLHDLNWPGPATVNPFIPLKLQREVDIPGSSAEANMKRCRLDTQNIISSTVNLVFSFAKMKEDTECRPSTILKQFISDTPGSDVIDLKRAIFNSSQIETFSDTLAPDFSQENFAEGGTGILTDQSACPFRAFARHRLAARGLDDTDIGLDPARRGLLVHSVMYGIWRQIGDSAGLNNMDDEELESLIKKIISTVIKQQSRHQPETYSPGFCFLEGRRLFSLIKQWMEIERSRPGFKILELEKKFQANFHGLKLRMRIDRIDELENGGQAVIDYKTGEVNPGMWQGERPEEPQLPLYAVTHNGNIRAVAYAGMKRGKLGYTGLAEAPGLIEGVAVISDPATGDVWRQQLAGWEETLERLAREYLQGDAAVKPRDSKTCQYCDLHSLCRINEREWHIFESTGDSFSPED